MNRPCNCNRCEIGQPWTKPQCRLCWLYHNDPRYARLWNEGFVAQVKKASKAVQRWNDAGRPLRTTEELEACFKICEPCEHYVPGLLPALHKCGKCRCFLSAKARMATETCPAGKWPASKGQQQQ